MTCRRKVMIFLGSVSASQLYGCGGGGDPAANNSGAVSNPVNQGAITPGFLGAVLATPSEKQNVILNVQSPLNFTASNLPPRFDLSTTGRLPTVGKQARGDCVAWGIGYSGMTYLKAKSTGLAITNSDRIASQADYYAKMISTGLVPYCNEGISIIRALELATAYAVASLSVAPYDVNQCRFPVENGSFKISGYTAITVNSRDLIKRHIASENIIIIGMRWPASLAVFVGSGIYDWIGDASIGGHCVSLVGYDDKKMAYKIMNSHGVQFGDAGFAWISYSAFESLVGDVYHIYESSAPINPVSPSDNSPATVVSALGYVLGVNFSNLANRWVYFSVTFNKHVRVKSYQVFFLPDGQRNSPQKFDWGNKVIDQTLQEVRFSVGDGVGSPAPDKYYQIIIDYDDVNGAMRTLDLILLVPLKN